MKRCLKKAVAFGLALSMFAGCMVVSAEENEGNGIAVIEDAVYDEAISFLDTVVLLENGHWAKRVKDEVTGERVPYTDVTAETNIVFIDGEGNKKVISNKDANGEMIFDAVLPEITNLDSNDFICVFKGENRAYISPEGEFFGDELKFYKDIQLMSEEYLWVSEDGTKYDLIKKDGEVIYSVNGFEYGYLIGNCIYVACKDRIIIINQKDATLVREYQKDSSGNGYFAWLGDDYVEVKIGDNMIVLNGSGEEKLIYSGGKATYVNYADYKKGYVEVLGYQENSTGITDIVNIETGQSLGSFIGSPDVYPDGYIYNNLNDSFYKIEENSVSLIADVQSYKDKMMRKEGISEGTPSVKYADGKLFVSIASRTNQKAVTYVYTKSNNYNDSEPIKLDGAVVTADAERGRILTQDYNNCLVAMYNFSMNKVKDYTTYEGVNIYSYGEAIPGMNSIFSSATINDSNGYSYGAILNDGSLTKYYKTFKESGKFLVGGSYDSELEVINGAGTVVYSGKGEFDPEGIMFGASSQLKKAYGLSNHNYFAVLKDDTCNVYDYYGNKVELGDNYSAIGPCEGISGSYRVSSETSYGYYCYSNDDLANGLCVTRKTDAEGNHKYGVIKFNVVLEKGDCNGDKLINAQDALAVLKHAAKISILPDESVGEVTGDGLVNAQDALKILQLAAHIIDSLD